MKQIVLLISSLVGLSLPLAAQAGNYKISNNYLFAHFDIENRVIDNWDLSQTTLTIHNDLTATWEGTVSSTSVTDLYQIRFDFVDPYQRQSLDSPEINWGNFSGSLTNSSTQTIEARFFDYNGPSRILWPDGFDAAFGVKRPQQGEWHPAPWTNGTAPDGSIEFGFWTMNEFGERNGDLNAVVTKKLGFQPVPEPSVTFLGTLSLGILLLRRKR
jgi:hypothetical protein